MSKVNLTFLLSAIGIYSILVLIIVFSEAYVK